MGITISTPNYFKREDQLAFPPEIVDKIITSLTPRDFCICREVCRSWMDFVAVSGFLEETTQIVVENSEHFLQNVCSWPLPPQTFCAFSLRNLELTKRCEPFWDLYSNRISHLDFHDCFFLRPSRPSSEIELKKSCPNLKHLGLRNMDKYFMMGGQFLNVHEFICLENLESLDISDNKYLSDSILFDVLLRTKKLRSIDVSSCPFVFMRAVHRRFYPSGKAPPYSDNILSFETLVRDFLCENIGSSIRELKIRSTKIHSQAIQLISGEDFMWESLDFQDCHELKSNDFMELITKNWDHLIELKLGSSASKLGETPLAQNVFPMLEVLKLDKCPQIANLGFVKNMPRLSVLSIADCYIRTNIMEMETLITSHLTGLTVLNLAKCGDFVTDKLVQLITENCRGLKRLNLQNSSILTDSGLEGLSNLQYLQHLNLNQCIKLSDFTWTSGWRLRDLSHLDLSGCELLTSTGLLSIASHCKSLEYLNILKCHTHLTSDPQVLLTVRNSLYRLRHFVF